MNAYREARKRIGLRKARHALVDALAHHHVDRDVLAQDQPTARSEDDDRAGDVAEDAAGP